MEFMQSCYIETFESFTRIYDKLNHQNETETFLSRKGAYTFTIVAYTTKT